MGDGCEPRKSSGFQLPNEWLRIVGGRLPLGNAACFGNVMVSGTYMTVLPVVHGTLVQ